MTNAATRRSLFSAAAGAAGAAALGSAPAVAGAGGSPAALLAAGDRAATWTGAGRLYGRRAGEAPRLIADVTFHRALRLEAISPREDQARAGLRLATFDWAALDAAAANPWTGARLPALVALGASRAALLALDAGPAGVTADRAGDALRALETFTVRPDGFGLTLETGWPEAFDMAGWTGGLTWRVQGAIRAGLPTHAPGEAAGAFAAWLQHA